MIENGHLVHGEIDTSLQAWQPESFFVTGLLIAILATVLSYQTTSLVYDLFLGIKPRGQVKAPDMHMLLLADEGSPLSVAAAVFRHDELDRARFYGDIPRGTTIVRNRARIGGPIMAKLAFMLLAAPFINLVAVFLALEFNQDVSFAEAGFGPVAFGFNRNRSLTLSHDNFGAKCFRIRTSFSHAADEHAEFFRCVTTFASVSLPQPAQTTAVSVSALPSGELQGTMQLAGFPSATRLTTHMDLLTDNNVYRIAQAFTQDDLEDLVKAMAPFMADSCKRLKVTEITPPPALARIQRIPSAAKMEPKSPRIPSVPHVSRQNDLSASQTFECLSNSLPQITIEAVLGYTFENSSFTTLVDTDTFRVVRLRDIPADGSEPSWFDGSDLSLLKRRTNFVPIGILFIVVGVLIIVRLFVECCSNNDVYDGIDEVIARNVGLGNSYSMIRSDRLMRYDHKYQRGLAAHYGTPQPGFPEVREFKGGSVGIGSPEDPDAGHLDDATKYYGEEIMNPTQID